jgi:hypothetical protein
MKLHIAGVEVEPFVWECHLGLYSAEAMVETLLCERLEILWGVL